MNIQEIKEAVTKGHTVHWSSDIYRVSVDQIGQWFITCEHNSHSIGLTHLDGVTLNGKEGEFYIGVGK